MVNYLVAELDRTFAALTDATRREILTRLESEGPITVSELAEPLAIKLPAVLKHLGVLAEAGLIKRSKTGRVVTIALEPDPMKAAAAWIKRYERFWDRRLNHLVRHAEAQQNSKRKPR
jgi:DNA-binding transcriptional ArsR family regulator